MEIANAMNIIAKLTQIVVTADMVVFSGMGFIKMLETRFADEGLMDFDMDSAEGATLRRAPMRALAGGVAGDMWAKIGRDVLDGGLALRDVARSGAYGDLFTDAADRLTRYRAKVGEMAFNEEGRRAGEVLAELRRDDPA
ncbi:hypothetical protein [Dactylosporangium salmoneum]|uniref:Uncharacterized protein n=1 Tax=Dactylosporangium salmoneum TaxID=53361 RepID=A0ABN3G0D2_9ACTN